MADAVTSGSSNRDDVKGLITTYIVQALEEYNAMDANALLAQVAFEYRIPLGQFSFTVPVINSGVGEAEQLGESGTASFNKLRVKEKSFSVKDWGAAFFLTKRSIDTAALGGLDYVSASLNTSMIMINRRLATELMTAVKTGWVNASLADEDVPPVFAEKVFDNTHDHIVTTGDLDVYWGEVAGSTTFLSRHLLYAADHINEHGYQADVAWIGRKIKQKLVKEMTDAGIYEQLKGDAQIKGFVARYSGLEIRENPWIPDDAFAVMDSTVKPVAFGNQEAPRYEQKAEFNTLMGQIVASFGFGIRFPLAGVYIIEGASS